MYKRCVALMCSSIKLLTTEKRKEQRDIRYQANSDLLSIFSLQEERRRVCICVVCVSDGGNTMFYYSSQQADHAYS